MTKNQKYEAIPTMEWFQKGLIKKQEGHTVRVYYYMLANSKPHFDDKGNFIDMRTSEEDTGKAIKIYNNHNTKTKGILNIDRRTYIDAIDILTKGSEHREIMYNDNGSVISEITHTIPSLLEPIHKEKTDGVTVSQMRTEFIIKPLKKMPGFRFSKIDKDLLRALSTFKNKYVISVLAHLLWQKAAYEEMGKSENPHFSNAWLCRGFGMVNPSNEQKFEIRDAVLMLEGAGIIETQKLRKKGMPFRRLLKINNKMPEGLELKEDELVPCLDNIEMTSCQDSTNEMEELWASRRSDNNGYYDF